MNKRLKIVYHPQFNGETERQTGRDTVYLGFVKRWPRTPDGDEVAQEIEAEINSEIRAAPDVLPDGWEVVDAGIVEVHVVLAQDNFDDFIVMVRIPYQEPQVSKDKVLH